jgi:hypothetical protein
VAGVDRGALSRVTEGVEGIESDEIAGVISRDVTRPTVLHDR